jgi:Lon protease-like protein
VGEILSHEKLSDGRYNLLLQGRARARVLEETSARPFRVARVQLCRPSAPEIDLQEYRERLTNLVRSLPQSPQRTQLQRIIASPLDTSDVADLLAFNFVPDAATKQSLLAEADAVRRIPRLIGVLESIFQTAFRASVGGFSLN